MLTTTTDSSSDPANPLIRRETRDAKILPEWRVAQPSLASYITPGRALVTACALVGAIVWSAESIEHERVLPVTIQSTGSTRCSVAANKPICETTITVSGVRAIEAVNGGPSKYTLTSQNRQAQVVSIFPGAQGSASSSYFLTVLVRHDGTQAMPAWQGPGLLAESRPLYAWIYRSTLLPGGQTL